MVVNWREKKECGHDAKEGADKDSVYFSVPLKSVGLNQEVVAEENRPHAHALVPESLASPPYKQPKK